MFLLVSQSFRHEENISVEHPTIEGNLHTGFFWGNHIGYFQALSDHRAEFL